MSSKNNNGDSYKSKKKWFRTRIRPSNREENRKYQKIKKDIKTKEKQKSKRSDTQQQNENKEHGTLVGSDRGYEAPLQKAVQLIGAQHNVNTILKKHGEARQSNLLTSKLLMKVNVNQMETVITMHFCYNLTQVTQFTISGENYANFFWKIKNITSVTFPRQKT